MEMSDTTISLIALSISAFSIIIGVIGMAIQRKHYRQTVRPICIITYRNYLKEISIFIENQGTGPLLIKHFWIQKKGDKYEDYNQIVKSVIPNTDAYTRKWVRMSGKVIGKDSKVCIFEFLKRETHNDYENVRDDIRNEMEGTEIFVEYMDIYEKTFPLVSRKLINFNKIRSSKSKILLVEKANK